VLDQEILASQVKADRFPFPCEGEITLAIRNANYVLGDRRQEWRLHCRIPHTETSSRYRAVFERPSYVLR
jgi:hypothetical protein